MRITGALQSGIAAAVLGLVLRGTPPHETTSVWPYIVFGYAMLAAIMPWFTGVSIDEIRVPLSVGFGITTALPCALSAWGLWTTPHSIIAYGFAGLCVLWGAHLLLVIGLRLFRNASEP